MKELIKSSKEFRFCKTKLNSLSVILRLSRMGVNFFFKYAIVWLIFYDQTILYEILKIYLKKKSFYLGFESHINTENISIRLISNEKKDLCLKNKA
ncbi:hypothetical protein BpHYR1_014439 [Brachionus plicatilis]|uniref:Uncharacterized protein n=1 Tax=Brachionus plicatilis TaxID=10195 RepID=A0A3M7RJS1_BRAPC|nr:hypothetical protein BpHYR1_014439 [Brachionus plicatilis]